MSSGEQFAPEALEAWPCGLALARLDGTLLACNRYFEELVGRTSEEMTGTTRFSELLTVPGKLFYDTHFLPQLRLQGRIHEIAFDLARRGQPAIPILLNAVIRNTADGASETVCYAVFKASERRRYERELLLARRNAEYLTELFKFSDDAIMTVSPDDVITNWNESATRLFGYAPSEVMGRKLPELIVPDDLQQEFRRMREKLADGTTQRLETVRVSRDGTRIDVSTTLTPHLEPPGIMVGYSCVIRDETERKKTAQALIRSEKIASVGRLASSISHEINNPLEAITNLLYLIAEHDQLPGHRGVPGTQGAVPHG